MTELQPTSSHTPIQAPDSKTPSNLLMVTLIVLVIFSLSGTGFLYWQNQQITQQLAQLSSQVTSKYLSNPSIIPTATTIPVIDPTPELKSYVNSKYKYSFKYPSSWILGEQCFDGPSTSACKGARVTVSHPQAKYPDGILNIDTVDKTCENLENSSWSKAVTKEKYILDGISGLNIKGKLDFNDNQLHDVNNICIPVGELGYHISTWSLNSPEQETVYRQILNTFKFTK